jgi:hypothetical protein
MTKTKDTGNSKFPTDELLKDIAKVFKKHGWAGNPIGIKLDETKATNTTVGGKGKHGGTLAIAHNVPDNTVKCTPPKKPTPVTVHLADGTLLTKIVCL